MTISDLKLWLGLASIPKLGLKTRFELLARLPDFRKWLGLSQELADQYHIPKSVQNLLQHPINWQAIETQLVWMQQHAVTAIPWVDPNYPDALKQIPNPPWSLFCMGNCGLIQKMKLAVVGSRKASPSGKHYATQFSQTIGAAGITIVSGFARGIDEAAHQSAMETFGSTIAVLAHGLMHCYPPQHRGLWSRMLDQGGLLVSGWLPNVTPRAEFFPHRNRVIAGLSRGVLVIEASLRSGSLITAELAAEYGRDVFALPHAIHHALGKGCHRLIREGAFLVESPQEILENWGLIGPKMKTSVDHSFSTSEMVPPENTALGESESRILSCFWEGAPLSFDVLLHRSGLTEDLLSSMLLSLELSAQVQRKACGYQKL